MHFATVFCISWWKKCVPKNWTVGNSQLTHQDSISSVDQPPAEEFARWQWIWPALADTEQVVFDGPVVMVSAGGRHAVSVTADALYSWGDGSRGQLGNGDAETRLRPSRLGRKMFGGIAGVTAGDT